MTVPETPNRRLRHWRAMQWPFRIPLWAWRLRSWKIAEALFHLWVWGMAKPPKGGWL